MKTRIIPELGSIPVENLTAKRINARLNRVVSSRAQVRPAAIKDPETRKVTKRVCYLEREDLGPLPTVA